MLIISRAKEWAINIFVIKIWLPTDYTIYLCRYTIISITKFVTLWHFWEKQHYLRLSLLPLFSLMPKRPSKKRISNTNFMPTDWQQNLLKQSSNVTPKNWVLPQDLPTLIFIWTNSKMRFATTRRLRWIQRHLRKLPSITAKRWWCWVATMKRKFSSKIIKKRIIRRLKTTSSRVNLPAMLRKIARNLRSLPSVKPTQTALICRPHFLVTN